MTNYLLSVDPATSVAGFLLWRAGVPLHSMSIKTDRAAAVPEKIKLIIEGANTWLNEKLAFEERGSLTLIVERAGFMKVPKLVGGKKTWVDSPSMMVLREITGAIEGWAAVEGWECETVEPRFWKVAAGIKPVSEKGEVHKALEGIWADSELGNAWIQMAPGYNRTREQWMNWWRNMDPNSKDSFGIGLYAVRRMP